MTAVTKKADQHLAVARAIADGCDTMHAIIAATGLDPTSANNSIRALLDKRHLGRSRGVNAGTRARYWIVSPMAEVERSFQPTPPPVRWDTGPWTASELERAWPVRVGA